MKILQKLLRRIKSVFFELLKLDFFRFYLCKIRWQLCRRNLKVLDQRTEHCGAETISHNLSAFAYPGAVFGMAKRMSLLLYPTAALLRGNPSANVLIVGPRTEDDIFWAWSLDLRNTRGLDLFSYSKYIAIGDIHSAHFESHTFDAILLGWMISYSSDPAKAILECKRLLKPHGVLGIGIESNPAQEQEGIKPPRVNSLNSSKDLINLVKEKTVFLHDPEMNIPYECAVIFKL